MKRIIFALQLAILIGCSSKGETTKYTERYLYFTSNFPSGISWEIVTSYTSNSNKLWCKDLSMGEGGLIQSTKTEHSILEKSGDTLKVPLFFPMPDNCKREITDLYLDPIGRHIRMPQISLLEKSNRKVRTDEMKPIPDSLIYLCKLDSLSEILNCEAEDPDAEFSYLLNDTAQINRFRIDLRGF